MGTSRQIQLAVRLSKGATRQLAAEIQALRRLSANFVLRSGRETNTYFESPLRE
jgi:hypothetical protein